MIESFDKTGDQVVVDFLRRVESAVASLYSCDNSIVEDLPAPAPDTSDISLVEVISRCLLRVCTPKNLLLGTEDLPSIMNDGNDENMLNANNDYVDEDCNRIQNRGYQYRRTDYLRLLLRFMAPISMQVASQICHAIVSDLNKTTPVGTAEIQAAFLLFAHWLPVAPHLTTMATELFRCLNDPWRALDLHQQANVFLFAEASYKLCSFFLQRQEISTIKRIWNWNFLFDVLQISDVEMDGGSFNPLVDFIPRALQWYAARALTSLLNWKPQVVASVMERLEISDEMVPWVPHPWELNREEKDVEVARFRGVSKLWNQEEVIVPSALQVANILPPSRFLAHIGNGIFFYKSGTLNKKIENDEMFYVADASESSLIPTATTCKNLALLGAALCEEPYPPPIMLCGPHGSGKSSILREMLRLCRPGDSLLEFHIDEETDSKTLIGSYSTTDVPGEFAWRPGALTHASRDGRWVLFEDIDTVPVEIQATVVKLLEDRMLPLGNGRYEKCHPEFRIFATCTTTRSSNERKSSLRFGAKRGGGRHILSPSLWRKIHIQPLPFLELNEVATALFPRVPSSVVAVTLSMIKFLDISGRAADPDMLLGGLKSAFEGSLMDARTLSLYTGGRSPSVRDLFKLLSRISHGICFEKDTVYATEAQRMICLAESIEILVGSCPDSECKEHFVTQVAAPAWGVSGENARAHIFRRRLQYQNGVDFLSIGRVKIHSGRKSGSTQERSGTFAETNHALRYMESIGVCVRQNEPVLLVGETGCGKTSMIQQLAGLCERELIVQNLSLQTDSTDLLGGFKPLELKNVARQVYLDFVDLFVSTFSRKQNAKFLQFASSMLEKENWKKLSQCFQRAAKLGTSKMKERSEMEERFSNKHRALALDWDRFGEAAIKFDRQIVSCDAGLAFVFSEGALVDAIKCGKWVLLDEINLASSDTLQRLCGLLDDPAGSITLTERGDASEVPRHPNFRLFAAMNPSTDAGKKDLPASIRSRFSELYVDELVDPVELRVVAARYLHGVLPVDGKLPEHKDVVVNVVEVYIKCRKLAETTLSDGAGHKPRYTLRTLSRALSASKSLLLEQRMPLSRALYEGFQLAFEGALDLGSVKAVKKVLRSLLPENFKKIDLEHPGRRPKVQEGTTYELVKPFWLMNGPRGVEDWSRASSDGKTRFILTPSISKSLRRLARVLAAGPWPVLLEGPTSAGKTTLVEYVAARCGHHVVRINNHEHTDLQEYTGSFTADQNGLLSFRDGLLVQALRGGHWVILDELNLAPSEVLEALNRLLDDNRELYLAETNETVKPHPDFRLFATQNPSGAYGGRKPLSRAFRNRFVELYMGDIPSDEMTTILEQRCGCPQSTATRLVEVMVALRYHRSKGNLFLGKDSLITPRDLLRWAERESSSRLDFAEQGYMLLAERLRSEEEKETVKVVIEEHLKVKLDPSEMYYGQSSKGRRILQEVLRDTELASHPFVATIAPTDSLLRLLSLVTTCIEQKEPVLLVGDTGCGKTTVVQFLSLLLKKRLLTVNCHATTETSDLLGGLRPIRGRDSMQEEIYLKLRSLLHKWPHRTLLKQIDEADVAHFMECVDQDKGSAPIPSNMPEVARMASIAKAVLSARPQSLVEENADKARERTNKRRKLSESCSSNSDEETVVDECLESLLVLGEEIQNLATRYESIFEWCDGPLVTAMKNGHMLLLDEMSLAEDAVLERLNSVLEPSRTLVLAEKGDDGSDQNNRVIKAHGDFRIFATMNPGGDFGKRELSPALRSRFTEIWVPAITEQSDFMLVVSRALNNMKDKSLPALVDKMMEYVNWFNKSICGDPSSPFAGSTLSLRDVLSWAHFIHEVCNVNSTVGVWEAYMHGAALMHLDGLGLGAGLAVEDAIQVRKQAEKFLSHQVGDIPRLNGPGVDGFIVKDGTGFGAEPFFVSVGQMKIPHASNFNLTAPTAATNAYRVLRGLQLSKPILLEGPPGVGKTSLVNALAVASGNRLVRINLSEQTDIADLMGSDLPTQNSNAGGAAFEWFDGVLLRAIKEGSWVLLDELNLASQSVLEGLNSCLDHRATVYIPELGRSFHCPSTFRVFGAQNPLGQGGGRKGLPKSFLNRFTKVYVDTLSDADLRIIVQAQYPQFDEQSVESMVNFNNQVHSEVTEKREYGSEGAPWEFNLRDIFRWCQLVESQSLPIDLCARDIYLRRFRNENDRKRLDLSYRRYFPKSMVPSSPPMFQVSESTVKIGDTALIRVETQPGSIKNSLSSHRQFFTSRLSSMESLARCVVMKWPSLVIGPSSSGKTSSIVALAELCNAKVVEQSLSPSSDVTELLGCFEQADSNESEIHIARRLLEVLDAFLSKFALRTLITPLGKRIWNAAAKLERYLENTKEFVDRPSFFQFAADILAFLETEAKHVHFPPMSLFERLESIRNAVEDGVSLSGTRDTSHFVWRDGILVEAMTNGFWLVLNNVNLCPSSVLDRLNSVMESDGELLLSECGSVDSDGTFSHRVIRPHSNFRIFLTMDSANGEVSRAMRNRCIEIYFQRPLDGHADGGNKWSLDPEQRIDLMGSLHTSGARSIEVANKIIAAHLKQEEFSLEYGEEICCARVLAASARMLSTMLCRGILGSTAVLDLLKVTYELDESDAHKRAEAVGLDQACRHRDGSLVYGIPIRHSWLQQPANATVEWEARVLLFFNERILDKASQENIEMILDHGSGKNERLRKPAGVDLRASNQSKEFQDALLPAMARMFLASFTAQDLRVRSRYFDNYHCHFVPILRWMAQSLEEKLSVFAQSRLSIQPSGHSAETYSGIASIVDAYLARKTSSLSKFRLDREYSESNWLEQLSSRDVPYGSSEGMTVLEASYLVNDSVLDRSLLTCPVTPIIYPLLAEIDAIVGDLALASIRLDPCDDRLLNRRVADLLLERDRLWDLLKTTSLFTHSSSFLGFEECEFLVQWKWMKRAFINLNLDSFENLDPAISSRNSKLTSLISSVDTTVFGKEGSAWSSQKVSKKLMHPLVPRESSHWASLFELRSLAEACSLTEIQLFNPFKVHSRCVDLKLLIERQHPLLFIDDEYRCQVLAALATSHSQCTDTEGIEDGTFPKARLQLAEVGRRLRLLLESRREDFQAKLARARIDTNISTVDNQFSAQRLEQMRESSESSVDGFKAYSDLTHSILYAFSRVQLSPFEEYCAIRKERNIISRICSAISNEKDDFHLTRVLKLLVPTVKVFIRDCLACLVWPVMHIRPYQTFVWAFEGSSVACAELSKLLRSLLAPMLASLDCHLWLNSFSACGKIASRLEVPNLWVDDETSNFVSSLGEKPNDHCLFGSTRIAQQVRTEMLLLVIGEQFALRGRPRSTRFFTIENCDHRIRQYQSLNKLLSSDEPEDSKVDFWKLQLLTKKTFLALREGLKCVELDPLLKFVSQFCCCGQNDIELSLDEVVITDTSILEEYSASIINPLLASLREAWKAEESSTLYWEKISLAAIYLGLLRLQLSSPKSPLDPGRAPVAKVSLIDRRLHVLRTDITAWRLFRGLAKGDFTVSTFEVKGMLNEGGNLMKKRTLQKRKVIERPPDALPFHELFRMARDFCEKLSSSSMVLDLVQAIMNNSDPEGTQRRVDNWLRTSASFCERIESDFAAYEDATMVMQNSIRMMQDGLKGLIDVRQPRPNYYASRMELFDVLLRYPMRDLSRTARLAIDALGSLQCFEEKNQRDITDSHFALVSAGLSRLCLRKRALGTRDEDLRNYFKFVDRVITSWKDNPAEEEDGRTLEEIQENKFREQFPDHRHEFLQFFEMTDDDSCDDGENNGDDDGNDQREGGSNRFEFTDSQLERLCVMFKDFFSGLGATRDSARTLTFHYGYNAAFALEALYACSHRRSNECMSGHVFAMTLCTPVQSRHSQPFSHLLNEDNGADFQNEPSPAEARRARLPLERLMARCNQLLTAFPGHSILLGVGRVCDKVCKFDIMTTPIAKIMTGMEVILRQAQDWEQHASDRVRLGEPLKDVGKLVATWRKLELESWPQLIVARKQRYLRKGRKHMMRLQSILRDGSQSFDARASHGLSDVSPRLIPSWVWKGVSAAGNVVSTAFESVCNEDMIALTKILDTFILTSPLGEFHERLEVLKTLAVQQELDSQLPSNVSFWRMRQARVVLSIHNYYFQFESAMDAKLASAVTSIQGKLKDEVKLAKWDEQTYYALAESTEKNHRKLMKILSELDVTLELNVGQLLQEERIKGVRSNVDVREASSTSVPPDSQMFPGLATLPSGSLASIEQGLKHCVPTSGSREWSNGCKFGTWHLDHLRRMPKYAKKMEKLLKEESDKAALKNFAEVGVESSTGLCTAVFDRLSSLRKKSTRPMKERALVDLFRELKRNGFTTTKWTVPDEVRSIEKLFQLPALETGEAININESSKAKLKSAEDYYQRCLAELSEYRAETSLLGSKYMSKRESDMMLALGESGMWMIAQQRSLLASVLYDHGRLSEQASAFKMEDYTLPLRQTSTASAVKNLDESFALATESLRQLSLFIKSSQHLLHAGSASEWARDAASKLDHFVDEMAGCKNICLRPYELLTRSNLGLVDEKKTIASDGVRLLIGCKEECKLLACLPVDCFDAPLEELQNVLTNARLVYTPQPSDQNDRLCPESFLDSLSAGIERSLIAFQNLQKNSQTENTEGGGSMPLWECQREMVKVWASTNLSDLNDSMEDILRGLRHIHDLEGNLSNDARRTLVGLTADFGVMIGYIQTKARDVVEATAAFYAHSSKLVYVLLRIFRILVSKGFCSDESAEDEGSDTKDDIEGMTFEDDVAGTGMGEGDGNRDVTEQLESEDQLSGLKNDQDDGDKDDNRETRQLNEEEADQGMEMEADFEGEMCDVPDRPRDEAAQDDDQGEELDREMGDETSPDEEVVDERMWNDSDDEEDIKKEEEKFEKESGVEGEAIEGATRTKDDDDGKAPSEPQDKVEEVENNQDQPQDEQQSEEDGQNEDEINEDRADRYEDQHHVDMKGGEQDVEGDSATEEQMQLDDDLNLDGEGEDEPEENRDGGENGKDTQVEEGDDAEENADNTVLDFDQGMEDENQEENEDTDQVKASSGAAERVSDDDDDHNDDEEMDNDDEQKDDEANENIQDQQRNDQEAHGVRSSNGSDRIIDDGENDEENTKNDENETGGDTTGSHGAAQAQTDSSGGNGFSERDGVVDETQSTQEKNKMDDIPNPFKNPGDASRFWHRKLNIIDPGDENVETTDETQGEEPLSNENDKGDFQYSAEDEQDPTQVLGEAAEEEAVKLDKPEEDQMATEDADTKEKETQEQQAAETGRSAARKQRQPSGTNNNEREDADDQALSDEDQASGSVQDEGNDDTGNPSQEMDVDNEIGEQLAGNHVVSDLSRLKVEGQDSQIEIDGRMIEDEQVTAINSSEGEEARLRWFQIQGETYSLSRRLCEKLRLVMEPLVASKLRGDYRTGKRINMKRVIGYIASGYRKDKIWLRRTKPSKRDYRVLLAVDDSESMKKSGAGEMALRALATLAVGMNQLEIGELGIASFGEDMKLLHPFHLPFGTDSGADMVMNFKFEQKRTRTSLCVESAIAALDSMGGSSSMQLMFLVSDGRIERDSRDKLKRLIREMMERNILLAMIIVEGEHKKKDSIVNMKEVTFENGKPVVKRFIEDYPFPYYIMLDDMASLPEVLGDALRQWFEMLTQLQSSR